MTVTYGDNRVQITLDPADGATLQDAEACARRLLAEAPAAPAPAALAESSEPFGFALGSDTERQPEDL
ncbi:hypothetical protein [Streptomyces stelliscabiei]|uniref:hypothetical protein n=1 Tax=Streptomyces stelliscabiei TaxID=146820 RepID=UPI0029B8C804|nr:hypothetical protein [Streptomyces stelliscabiei]MDX2551339.1 hypothetical protein [Streptomyces stelliscabiei]